MSKEDLQKFREALNDDEELQQKLTEAMSQEREDEIDEEEDDDAPDDGGGIDLNVLVGVAKDAGYDVTVEEATEVYSSLLGEEGGEAELTDYELELVAGGWWRWRRRRRRRRTSSRRRSGGGHARSVSTLEV